MRHEVLAAPREHTTRFVVRERAERVNRSPKVPREVGLQRRFVGRDDMPPVVTFAPRPEKLVHANSDGLALDGHLVEQAKLESFSDGRHDRLAHDGRDAVLLAEPFEAGGQVDPVAESRVAEARRRAEVAHHDASPMQTEAREERPESPHSGEA